MFKTGQYANEHVEKEFPKEHWAKVQERWAVRLPASATPEQFPDHHRLFHRFLEVNGGQLYEIGCAPGRWLAYFAREFRLKVGGLEYVEKGVALTRLNLDMQGIAARVEHGDFFTASLPEGICDVVYSAGFIEHFEITQTVVDRLVRLARLPGGYVITTVPNFLGLNGWIRKRWVPESYAAHAKLSPGQLRGLHERAGVQTLFCNYGGVPYVRFPSQARPELVKADTLRGDLGSWMRYLINGSLKRLFRMMRWVPRSRVFSPTIIYIGRR